MVKKIITGSLFILLLISCQDKKKEAILSRYDYPNILNLQGEIETPNQEGVASFSDLGTWHSFSLNYNNSKKVGQFVGPYLMRQQKSFWLSPSVIGLQIKDADTGELMDLSSAKNVTNVFYPGLLKQTFEINDLIVNLYLYNTNERTSAISAELMNKGAKRRIQLGWNGNVFSNLKRTFSKNDNGIQISINEKEEVNLLFNTDNITVKDSSYNALERPIAISKGEEITSTVAFIYTFSHEETQKYKTIAQATIKDAERAFQKNEERWNTYLSQLNQGSKGALLDVKKYNKLAVKSLLTLIHNWRSAAGDIFHQGIVPSYYTPYFQGLWAWDSWKHAVAIAPFEGELAKDQIRAMYDYQNEAGMIADCFFRDLSIEGVNWRNTKAPLSGWSVYKVYEATEDIEFLKELYPQLIKYHEWWYINRDHDKNGLCEYGSTDGTRIAAAWESGMDNAVRFDNAKIIENRKGAYSIDQESVDLNAYLYQEKLYIERIAKVLGEDDVAEKYRNEAQVLKENIRSKMFCEEDGFFYDIELKSHKKIRIQGPEGWAALYNNVASEEQAKEVIKVILDPKRFNTPMPFPTLSAAHEKFNPQRGYWRGPVWLDQAYFAIEGMNNYGHVTEAKMMAEKMVESAEGLAHSQEPIRENYHPLTKEGLNAEHFSWSAAHILMLF